MWPTNECVTCWCDKNTIRSRLCWLVVGQKRDLIVTMLTGVVTGTWPARHCVHRCCDRNVTWSSLCWPVVWRERDLVVTMLTGGVTGTWPGKNSGDQHGPYPNHRLHSGGSGQRVRRGGDILRNPPWYTVTTMCWCLVRVICRLWCISPTLLLFGLHFSFCLAGLYQPLSLLSTAFFPFSIALNCCLKELVSAVLMSRKCFKTRMKIKNVSLCNDKCFPGRLAAAKI